MPGRPIFRHSSSGYKKPGAGKKEHPSLTLFVDEVHRIIGAGSALDAPSDAANVFKSVRLTVRNTHQANWIRT